jgi:hypothetical protein
MIDQSAQPDLYLANDPDPVVAPAEPAAEETPRRGRKPATGEAPNPKAAEARAKRAAERTAARQAATKTAPEVQAEKGGQTPAEQVVRTLSDLTEDQRRSREFTLGLLSHAWNQGTARLLGVALARPADKAGADHFDEIVAARPDVGGAAAAFSQWLTAFDAVAIKRDWYKEMPAEWMLAAATVGLMATVGVVVFNNVKMQRAGQAQAAKTEDEARKRSDELRREADEATRRDDVAGAARDE